MTDVQTAERDAAHARAAVTEAEADIAAGRRRVGPAKLIELLGKARHADLAAQAEHEAAEQRRIAARAAALRELGARIDEVATADTGLAEDLAALASARARVLAKAAARDVLVSELRAAAGELGARTPVPGGIRRGDEGIALTGNGVRHETTVLVPVGPQAAQAIQHAAAGDLEAAQAAIKPAHKASGPTRADAYYRGRGGMIVPVFGDLTTDQRAQVRNGHLIQMSDSQVRDYLDGRELRADHYLRPAAGGPVMSIIGDLSEHQRQQVRTGVLIELDHAQMKRRQGGAGQ